MSDLRPTRRWRLLLLGSALAAFALVAAAACGGARRGGRGAGGRAHRLRPAGLRRGLAFYGKSEETGLLLAVQQINEAGGFTVGGVNYTIDVITRDSRSEDAVGIAAV